VALGALGGAAPRELRRDVLAAGDTEDARHLRSGRVPAVRQRRARDGEARYLGQPCEGIVGGHPLLLVGVCVGFIVPLASRPEGAAHWSARPAEPQGRIASEAGAAANGPVCPAGVGGERIGSVWSSPCICRSWSSEARGSRSRGLHARSTPRG